MRKAIQMITVSVTLAVLSVAQETTPEPDFAKVPEAPTAEEIAAKEAGFQRASTNALSVAHQLAASQGYRQRDANWIGELSGQEFTIVPLQLYAGNDYYVVVGSDNEDEAISASAFDPDRMLVKASPDSSPGKLVFHITPKVSGPHYLRLRQTATQNKLTRCVMTYIYK